MPDAPIAISFRTHEEARRRADALGEQAPRAAGSALENALVPHTDDLRSVLDRVLGGGSAPQQRFLGRLALLDPRSGEVTPVEGARRGSVPLAWSADRERLLYTQPSRQDFQLWEFHLGRGTVRQVTFGPPAHPQGCYGPDGRIVAAAMALSREAPRSSIVMSQPGGRRPFVTLARGPADHSPACAPDGAALAYVQQSRGGRGHVVVRAPILDSSPLRVAPGRDPAFSPDGGWIVFGARTGRQWRLWRVRPDGSGRAPIGSGVRTEMWPTVSPDGRLVAYVTSEQPPRTHLYLRRFDGSGDRILFSNGDTEYPVW
jgi:Tol biopolymer transport system component